MSRYTLSTQRLIAIGAFALAAASGHLKAQANSSLHELANPAVRSANGVTVLNAQNDRSSVDFVHAKPMALPIDPSVPDSRRALLDALASAPAQGESRFSPGGVGDGKQSPVFLGTPDIPEAESNGETLEDFGTYNHPFTTAKADLYSLATNTFFPYAPRANCFLTSPGALPGAQRL